MDHIMLAFISALFLRILFWAFFPETHAKDSLYWEASLFVAIAAIIFFVIKHGIDLEGNYNIGTVLGFFIIDILGSNIVKEFSRQNQKKPKKTKKVKS